MLYRSIHCIDIQANILYYNLNNQIICDILKNMVQEYGFLKGAQLMSLYLLCESETMCLLISSNPCINEFDEIHFHKML